MRTVRTDQDTRRFATAEYLTEIQLCALFSRWNAQEQHNCDKRSPTDEPSTKTIKIEVSETWNQVIGNKINPTVTKAKFYKKLKIQIDGFFNSLQDVLIIV